MGKNNSIIKQWLSDKERFASFVNGSLFGGTPVFHADTLKSADGQQNLVLKNVQGQDIVLERYRDITMTAHDNTRIVIIACENQEKIHYAMPVRNMLYDALSYVEQINSIRQQRKAKHQLKGGAEFLSGLKAEDLLVPTLTLVFYYGEARWDGHTDLYGLLGIDREEYKLLRKYIPNYTINLIDPREIDNLECFNTDLQMIFGMLQYRKQKSELRKFVKEHATFFSDIDIETSDAVKVFLGSEKLFQNTTPNETGGMNMCQALDELYQDGIDLGIERGIEQGMHAKLLELINKKREKGMTPREIADVLEEPVEVIENAIASAAQSQ